MPGHQPPEAWAPVQRAAAAIAAPIQRILATEATSGIVLLAATVVAMLWANVWPDSYQALWHASFGVQLGPWSFAQSLEHWVNDGLMTVFFFVVGLEIRREMFEGELATFRKAALPAAAAIGGMLVPAVIFALLNVGRTGAAGWAVPMATDIAFAVGVLTLLGSRVPGSLRVLLLALAVIDDIGAIIVISAFYSGGISIAGLALVVLGLAVVWTMRAAAIRTPILYVIPGAVVWAGFLAAGIHPTIAGVILGLLTPVRPWFGPSGFAATTQRHLEHLPALDRDELHDRLDRIARARQEAISPVERLLHALHPYVAFGVMPVFALANAGVELGGASLAGDGAWLFAGIVVGLALGKPLGITVAALASIRAGLASRSEDLTTTRFVLVGMVGGIGFTMALFIAQLAFPPGPLLDTAKLAILVGSGVAIIAGLVLGFASRRSTSVHVE